jgi:hypothetical protein
MSSEKTSEDTSRPKTVSREERAATRSVQSTSEVGLGTTAGSEARTERKKKRHD